MRCCSCSINSRTCCGSSSTFRPCTSGNSSWLLLREQLLASLAGNSDRLKQLDAAPSDGQRVAAEGLWHHKQADVANRPAPPLLPDMFQPKKLVGGVCYS